MNTYPLKTICRVLKIARSGFYVWQKQKRGSARQQRNQFLMAEIRSVFEESRRTYGSPRVFRALRKKEVSCSLNLVAKLMKKMGLRSICKRKYKATTNSKHKLPISPDLLNRNFQATTPNEKWVGDITYVRTDEGWLYVALVTDLFSRKIVGYSMSDRIDAALAASSIQMAISSRNFKSLETIFHSDRGSQYASKECRDLLKKHKIRQSMGSKGDCYDNASAESCNGTLKGELVNHEKYSTRKEAKSAIFEFIEVFYNRFRMHSSLDYKSPDEYENFYATHSVQ